MALSDSYVAITRLIIERSTGERLSSGTASDLISLNAANWNQLYEVADSHDLVPLVYQGVLSLGPIDKLEPHIFPFKQKYELNGKRNHILRDELLYLVKELRQRDIEILPYKEPLSFSLRQPDIGIRQFKDIDFLIDQDDLDGIYSVLESLGFRLEQPLRCFRNQCYERFAKDYSFVRSTGRTTGQPIPDVRGSDREKAGWLIIEPHWSIAANRIAVQLPFRELKTRLVSADYHGEPINLLSPEDAHLVACVVGSKSEWRSLRLIADVAASVEEFPSLDWEWCLEKAKEARALRMFLLGNLLAARIAAAKIPESIYDRAVRDEIVADVAKDIQANILEDSFPIRADPRRFSQQIFALRENRKDRLHYLFGTFTTPRVADLRRLPLPGSLYFIHCFISPLMEYLVRPAVRCLRSLLRAIRSVGLR